MAASMYWHFPAIPWEIYSDTSRLNTYFTICPLHVLHVLNRKVPITQKNMHMSLPVFSIVFVFFSVTKSLTLQISDARIPWWLKQKRIHLQCRRPSFNPRVRKIPWRREWQPTPVFLPAEFHGKRRLAGYSP